MPLTAIRRPHLYVGGLPSLLVPTTSSNRLASTIASGTNAILANIDLGDHADDRVVCVMGTSDQALTLRRATINGSDLLVEQASTVDSIFCVSGVIPNDRKGVLVLTFSSGLGNAPFVSVWVMYGLSTPRPRASALSTAAIDTARSVDLAPVAGGIAVMHAGNDVITANSCTWSGDQTPTEVIDVAVASNVHTAAYVTNTNEDATNTFTSTFAVVSTTAIALVGATFR